MPTNYQRAGFLAAPDPQRAPTVPVFSCEFCGGLVIDTDRHTQHHSETATAITTLGDVIQGLIFQRLGLAR